MTITTKFDVGESVFCFDKYGTIKQRYVMGIRTQYLANGKSKTIYSFVKDGHHNTDFTGEMPNIYVEDDFFWLPEEKVYENKDELIKSLYS